MYKMIAIDMDGTLLNHQQQISLKNMEAIGKAQEKGIKVILSTGRAITGIQIYLEQLGLFQEDIYSVTCSGAYVVNNIQTKTLEERHICFKDLDRILKAFDSYDIHLNLYTDKKIYTKTNNFTTHIDAIANRLPMEIVNFSDLDKEIKIIKITLINEDDSVMDEIKSIYPNIELTNMDMPKVNNKSFNKNLFQDLTKLPSEVFQNYTTLKTTPYHIELLHKQCSKGSGVKKVAEAYGIKPNEVICIGDSGNDQHMIEYAGLGVAMGNARDEIKEIADYVTLTNEENGVAHVIEKFILSV